MKYQAIIIATAAWLASSSPLTVLTPNPVEPKSIPLSKHIEKNLDRNKAAVPGATVTKVRYGPYSLKANTMIEDLRRWSFNIPKPCEACFITAMQADLEDKAGNSINIDSGAWLHHILLMNGLGVTPGSKSDTVCTGYGLGTFGYPNRIFASGNERAPVRINEKYKYGIRVDKGDMFHTSVELVNQSNQDRDMYIVVIYEWVPITEPGYKEAKMAWVDITGCGWSDAPGLEGIYEYKSPGWKSTVAGALLYTYGHTHDGGASTTLYINDKPVCRSEMLYGTKPEYFEKNSTASSHSHTSKMVSSGGPDSNHISDVTSCVNFGILKKGDNVYVGATYNTSAHALNPAHPGHEGRFAPVMGNHPIYIAEGLMSF